MSPQPVELSDDMHRAAAAYRRAMVENQEANDKRQAEHAENSRRWSQANVEQARRVGEAYRKP